MTDQTMTELIPDDFEEDDDGQILVRGLWYCGTCGELAQPGNEEYDWCDHATGDGCSNAPIEAEDEDDEGSYYD